MSEDINRMLGVREEGGRADQSTRVVGASHVVNRYQDAYRVAAAIITTGSIIKVIGAVLGLGLGFVAFAQVEKGFKLGTILWFAGAVITWLGFYLWGVMVSAQGQLIRATLDSAVNTSPFLEREDKARAMSL